MVEASQTMQFQSLRFRPRCLGEEGGVLGVFALGGFEAGKLVEFYVLWLILELSEK